jgi:FKBP-type peptidyl-prolyl cis-trans isomerase FkpA
MTRRVLLVCLAIATVACGGGDDNGSPTAPSEVTGSAPFSTADLVVGTGAEAASGQVISVNYTGWLYSDTAPENKGRQFDTSSGRGVFVVNPLGAGRVIRGWDQGIPGMRVGGRRRIVIPPELAYGASGTTGIPPNATLLFEIELVSIP